MEAGDGREKGTATEAAGRDGDGAANAEGETDTGAAANAEGKDDGIAVMVTAAAGGAIGTRPTSTGTVRTWAAHGAAAVRARRRARVGHRVTRPS
jgi:hypothetical protein